jgi:alpha-L-rhamnosidase
MILAQIEEWFHTGLAGIRPANGAIAYRSLVVQPKLVGDLTHVKGSYRTPHGTARSEWTRTDRRFTLAVTVPPNTDAEVWVPVQNGHHVQAPRRAQFIRVDGTYAIYRVNSGTYTFTTVPR